MKCLAMLKLGHIGWIDKPVPVLAPLEALIKPIVLSPCTSDTHTVWSKRNDDRTNLVLGHEGVGEIVEVGPSVKDFKPGDKVIIPAVTPDWGSLAAQAGFAQHSNGMFGGFKLSSRRDGLFAEFCSVNDADANLAHLPTGVAAEDAVMLSDMVPTGFHAAQLAEIEFGDSVVVIGIGPVGLMAVAACNLSGAGRIFAVGSRPNCIAVAKQYGATDIINYREGDIVEQIMQQTQGMGVDKVIIAGGDVDTFAQAVTLVKPGGIVANVNYLDQGEWIKIPRLAWGLGMAHKRIVGGLTPGGRYKIEKLAALVQYGKLDTSLLITHRFHGIDYLQEALLMMKDKPKDLIKPVVTI